jgi:hypothetical protein
MGVFILMVFFVIGFADQSQAAKKLDIWGKASKIYCEWTHPVELFNPIRYDNTCEQQHVFQQQNGGAADSTVYWAASHHIYTDSTKSRFDLSEFEVKKPFEDNPFLLFGDSSKYSKCDGDSCYDLVSAYKMGTYGLPYSFWWNQHRGSMGTGRGVKGSTLLTTEFDGVSHLLYGYSYLVNIPQKQINQLAYYVNKDRWFLILDWVVGLFVQVLEVGFCLVGSVVGLVVGTIFNPFDTVFSIPNGIVLLVQTTWVAVSQLVFSIFNLVTSNLYVGIVTVLFLLGAGAAGVNESSDAEG